MYLYFTKQRLWMDSVLMVIFSFSPLPLDHKRLILLRMGMYWVGDCNTIRLPKVFSCVFHVKQNTPDQLSSFIYHFRTGKCRPLPRTTQLHPTARRSGRWAAAMQARCPRGLRSCPAPPSSGAPSSCEYACVLTLYSGCQWCLYISKEKVLWQLLIGAVYRDQNRIAMRIAIQP